MTEVDVRPGALRAVARDLRRRGSSLADEGPIEARPDAGGSSGEVGRMLDRAEEVTRALGESVEKLADGVDASVDRYDRSDAHARSLLRSRATGTSP
jgi:hypothetical protein